MPAASGLWTYFVDRCLSRRRFAEPLREREGLAVLHLDELYRQDTPDDVWIREVARKRWVILTADLRIRYRAAEVDALSEASALAVLLSPGHPPEAQLEHFLAARSRVEAQLERRAPPVILRVRPVISRSRDPRKRVEVERIVLGS